jgi:hypothetical protein
MPSDNYVSERNFADSYNNEVIEQILRPNLGKIANITIASIRKDVEEATDFQVKIDYEGVACRLRRASFVKYNDLTIRGKNGDSETEIHKLRRHLARWFVYGYVDDRQHKILKWYLIDIFQMIRCHILEDEYLPTLIMNKDGKTGFYTFSFKRLNELGCIIAGSENCRDKQTKLI